ncbi:tyrosine-protein phosphatase [Alisedimentitalea sp. MJ-SS2]|uniref:tyrosine-protein phosphatase n=1 Tax=Aliisedimentitalea sp. MJ-SS2 TaxID=3049795 RepID=UPI00290723E0|nr:tyrosine-protein phosphatase [Alisedimentitalea sp. MJ-SS2]MDU8929289.1 tyrosine-protein phosphatase [Alisedimentitalea sp. MJ-SS2]
MRKFRDMISHRVDTPRARLASVLFTEFVDHGFLRHLWTNVKEIDAGVFRSNQPNIWRLRRFKRRGGVSVLNLRGGRLAPVALEIEACDDLGLEYFGMHMASTELPSRDTVLKLIEMMERLPRPVMMHCKSGADRTGLASGIYLMAFKGVSPEEAAKQLTWKHAHLWFSKKGVLRSLFKQYQPAYDKGQDFMDWVRNDYDPKAGAKGGFDG